MDNLIIIDTDFDCITDVAPNCGIDRLCVHIREAQNVHLINKICYELIEDLIANPSNHTDLLDGSVFTYNGVKHKHFGIKRILVHYAYGLYKYSNNYVDQPYGTVYKQVADSVPVDDKILTRIRNEHFNLANEYWKMTELYLKANEDTYDMCKEKCNNDCGGECGICSCSDSNNVSNSYGKSRIRKSRTFKKY